MSRCRCPGAEYLETPRSVLYARCNFTVSFCVLKLKFDRRTGRRSAVTDSPLGRRYVVCLYTAVRRALDVALVGGKRDETRLSRRANCREL